MQRCEGDDSLFQPLTKRNGTKPVNMKDGSSRTFIEDEDIVILSGVAEKDGTRISLGECVGQVRAAHYRT